jgi:hypothetical protein
MSEDVSKTGFLWKMLNAKEQLRIVRADLMEEGSFDAAVSGVSCVFHTASPVAINPDMNPEVEIAHYPSIISICISI